MRRNTTGALRAFDFAIWGLKQALGLLLLAGVALNFTNVCLRYLFGAPFPWTEEIMIFGLVLVVMAGTVVATAYDRNLKIDVLVALAPPKSQLAIRVFSQLIWMAVAIYLATQSYIVVALMMQLGQTSTVTRLPIWIPHSFLLVSLVLSACAALYAVVRLITTGRAAGEPDDEMKDVGA